MPKNLDERLESQEWIAGMVKALPEEEPSLQWRSELNERLLAVRKPRPAFGGWRSFAGLGLAGALAVAFFVQPRPIAEPEPPASPVVLADSIITAHKSSVARQELGTSSSETLGSDTGPAPSYWQESDLSTL